MAAAAGEGEEWVERVGVQWAGVSGDRGSGRRLSAQGRPGVSQSGGRGEGGRAWLCSILVPILGTEGRVVSGATVTSYFFQFLLGWRPCKDFVSGAVFSLVLGGGPGHGGEAFKTSLFAYVWPCCGR